MTINLGSREADEAYIVMQLSDALLALQSMPDNDLRMDRIYDAVNNACGCAGWAFYEDDNWFEWQLKATQHEILIEMLKRCLERVSEKHNRIEMARETGE